MNTSPTLFPTAARLAGAAAFVALSLGGTAHAQALDLNRATAQQLSTLLCQKLYVEKRKAPNTAFCNTNAQRIISGRVYRSVTELKSRNIVSAATYSAIARFVTFSAPTVTPVTPTPVRPTTPTTPTEQALPFPKAVDHTAKQSPARDQGRRGTCMAFATTAGMEAYDKSLDLSEQQAFWMMREKAAQKSTCVATPYDAAKPELCQDKGCYGTNLATAVSVLQSTGLATERDWVYETLDNKNAGVSCHESITWASKLPSGLAAKRKVKLGRVEWLAAPGGYPAEKRVNDPMVLMAVLAQGYPINIAIGVAGSGWSSGTMIDVELDPTTKQPVKIRGGHGLLLVGYDYDKKAFKFKNSWGSSWGQSGFGWFTFDYLKTYITGGYYATGIVK